MYEQKPKQKKSFMSMQWMIVLVVVFLVSFFASYTNVFDSFFTSEADQHVNDGALAFQDGDYDAAVEHLTLALQTPDDIRDNDLATVYTILGNVYTELDQYDLAIENHQKALEIDPDFHNAWVNLGVAYRYAGDLDNAEASYIKAMELEPEYPELRTSLGALYVHRNQPDKAIIELEYSLELDPSYAITYSNLSIAYAMVGRFDDAYATLDKAVEHGYQNGEQARDLIDSYR